MKIWKYSSYDEYLWNQFRTNERKHKKKYGWERKHNVKMLARYLDEHNPRLKFGLCHGSRSGAEQHWFRQCLKKHKTEVIGTEISPTAKNYPFTIQWDFHNVKKKWINNVDFIYSNSFDHSYKPKECLDAWMSCIREKTGICIIAWEEDIVSTVQDPFAATYKELKKLISNEYKIIDILDPVTKRDRKYFLIKH